MCYVFFHIQSFRIRSPSASLPSPSQSKQTHPSHPPPSLLLNNKSGPGTALSNFPTERGSQYPQSPPLPPPSTPLPGNLPKSNHRSFAHSEIPIPPGLFPKVRACASGGEAVKGL
ncbi:unnamed protein product [Tuber aestivum]|uniref:Uncharacterized protein n=1 Tax=Tuber aestivum TaxID=59557 RepID=A0A292PVD2_9PEZI|nr:unnamed protein product [Tuber aestivum]